MKTRITAPFFGPHEFCRQFSGGDPVLFDVRNRYFDEQRQQEEFQSMIDMALKLDEEEVKAQEPEKEKKAAK